MVLFMWFTIGSRSQWILLVFPLLQRSQQEFQRKRTNSAKSLRPLNIHRSSTTLNLTVQKCFRRSNCRDTDGEMLSGGRSTATN